jgi:hypothetical protein
MADCVRFALQSDGAPLPIVGFDGVGVMLKGDIDVFPRRVSLELSIPSERDRHHFVQTLQGRAVQMKAQLKDGHLEYRCLPGAMLPRGTYQYRLRVDGIPLQRRPGQFVVSSDGSETVDVIVPGASDSRQVALTAEPDAFDPMIRALVNAPDSRIDGRPAADWIRDPLVEARRKACVLNILAKLRCTPSRTAPLIPHVEAILGAQLDRIYVRVSPTISAAGGALRDQNLFRYEGSPRSATHQLLLLWIRARQATPENPAIRYPLVSFREASTRNSLQVVVATPEANSIPAAQPPLQPACYADIDIDLGGSLTDVKGFAIHMGELVQGDITDHLALRAALAADAGTAIGPYLYYSVNTGSLA